MSIILLVIPLACYVVFFAAVFYHLKRYAFRDRASKKIKAIFAIGSVILVSCVIASYFYIDWESFSPFFEIDFGEIFSGIAL